MQNIDLTLPIELINGMLKDDERALMKSIQSFENGSISVKKHRLHKRNLNKRIVSLKYALELLTK